MQSSEKQKNKKRVGAEEERVAQSERISQKHYSAEPASDITHSSPEIHQCLPS